MPGSSSTSSSFPRPSSSIASQPLNPAIDPLINLPSRRSSTEPLIPPRSASSPLRPSFSNATPVSQIIPPTTQPTKIAIPLRGSIIPPQEKRKRKPKTPAPEKDNANESPAAKKPRAPSKKNKKDSVIEEVQMEEGSVSWKGSPSNAPIAAPSAGRKKKGQSNLVLPTNPTTSQADTSSLSISNQSSLPAPSAPSASVSASASSKINIPTKSSKAKGKEKATGIVIATLDLTASTDDENNSTSSTRTSKPDPLQKNVLEKSNYGYPFQTDLHPPQITTL
ncbi:hypothetical protein BCR33DRAFT_41087 [Rhizoclosmatium globosum]|uniref:Uncharacterized protein n=1 Tax=Rhizoclosmatium globosum TaxID=329046 RepID=A0A1Y2CNW2_9FUNG|nr:hypothetical protein BCR33DRAFT_41087 [Rhizoclosmatium globosum]|eukprot:ORY48657.1 hypothetical protein BCR33DRAFT_41087 [Rhizoclosmatium globosum]